MTYHIVWELQAVGAQRRLREEDPAGAAEIRAAIEALAGDPRPRTAVPLGRSGYYRLHRGQYRVMYELVPENETVIIVNVGRSESRRGR